VRIHAHVCVSHCRERESNGQGESESFRWEGKKDLVEGERENNGQGESESFNTREREIFGKGERKSTPQGCIATKMKERE
jgi:hypothetical protein